MKKLVPIQTHVEVNVPGNFSLGGAERFKKDLEELFAQHSDWKRVSVSLVYQAVCSDCGRDWEPDHDYPGHCAYCGN
jgi:hypothetical protein